MRARSAAAALLLAAVACVTLQDAAADGPADLTAPNVAYAYPAGGAAGTVVPVVVGGQNLRGVVAAHVSGQGVRAEVVRSIRMLSPQQQQELVRRMAAEMKRRRDEAKPDSERRGRRGRGGKAAAPEQRKEENRVELPDHPDLNDLTALSEQQLYDVYTRFVGPGRKRQPNAQLAEMVELLVEIAPGARPGWRELRLETREGLANPVRFRIDDVTELNEHERGPSTGGDRAVQDLTGVDVPFVVNGQILAGDVDRFRVRSPVDRRLAVAVEARALVPFLADAVPGWFQAVLCVRDAAGHEVAYCDDADFDPDPRLYFDAQAGADYVVEVRDAIDRGRDDFVYRLSIRDDIAAALTPSGGAGPPARLAMARSDGPSVPEEEPNDRVVSAQGALLPLAVRGRIAWPGDVDVFVFAGKRDQELVVDVAARRLLSPLDAVVRLVDPEGRVVAWSDDQPDVSSGLLTHDADPYLRVRLPADGAYAVEVTDVCGHGGARHDYLLRVGPPRPDFELIVTPSGVSVPAGQSTPIHVHAVRRDGFAGPIDVALIDPPEGFALSGARIPAGADSVRMTLTAPRRRPGAPLALRLGGRARIGDALVSHEATPADDRMQAFILRHLVPASEWLVAVKRNGGRNAPPVEIATPAPVIVPPAGEARVDLRVPGLPADTVFELKLDAPPEGIALTRWEAAAGRLSLFLTADPARAAGGVEDNLIVEVWAAIRGRRVFVGHLPAIAVRLEGRP